MWWSSKRSSLCSPLFLFCEEPLSLYPPVRVREKSITDRRGLHRRSPITFISDGLPETVMRGLSRAYGAWSFHRVNRIINLCHYPVSHDRLRQRGFQHNADSSNTLSPPANKPPTITARVIAVIVMCLCRRPDYVYVIEAAAYSSTWVRISSPNLSLHAPLTASDIRSSL